MRMSVKFFDENPLIDKLHFILIRGDGYDQNKIKPAFLSDLVRCSLFQQRLYSGILLVGKHEGRLIDILAAGGVELSRVKMDFLLALSYCSCYHDLLA